MTNRPEICIFEDDFVEPAITYTRILKNILDGRGIHELCVRCVHRRQDASITVLVTSLHTTDPETLQQAVFREMSLILGGFQP